MTDAPAYFVILGAMRTGSNLLEKTLEHLGDTDCYGEAFNPSFVSGPRKKDVLGYTLQTRDADPIGFLETLIAAKPSKIAGFRLFVGHSAEVTDYVLKDPRCARIILTRDPVDSFISLKIAQKTNQWMLRNPRRRIETRIRFEPDEFQRYQARLQKHYAWIDAELTRHATDAFRVDYSELDNQSVLQRIATSIGSAGTVPATAPILRQNPQSRAAKVENHAQMSAHLGLPSAQEAEQSCTSTHAFVPQPLWPPDFPIAYAPIYGNAFEPMVALLHRIEVRDFQRPEIPPPDRSDRASRAVLYTTQPPSNVQIITMVSHPLVRLHAAFMQEMFGTGFQLSSLRRSLVRSHGPMPPPKALIRGHDAYGPERHRHHFAGFLQQIEKALSGDDGVPLQAGWRTQADLLDDQRKRRPIEQVFKHEDFAQAVHWLTDQMQLPRFAPGQIKGLGQTGRQKLLPLQDVLTPELSEAAMRLHADDYSTFGYDPYPDPQ